MVLASCTFLLKPLKSCDKITPELPLAPLSEPVDMAFAMDFISSGAASTSFTADRIVSVILVPVSPSGTGNTLSSLIYSLFLSRLLAPAINAFFSASASIVLLTLLYPPN